MSIAIYHLQVQDVSGDASRHDLAMRHKVEELKSHLVERLDVGVLVGMSRGFGMVPGVVIVTISDGRTIEEVFPEEHQFTRVL